MAKKSGMKLIANNKKAFHDYFIEDTYEAGIALVGTEVKSLRAGKCSVKESFIRVENGEVYIYGMHPANCCACFGWRSGCGFCCRAAFRYPSGSRAARPPFNRLAPWFRPGILQSADRDCSEIYGI